MYTKMVKSMYNKNCFMKSKNLPSQTLLEVVLAVGLSVAVLAALVILAAASIRTVNSALARTTATKLANSGIEAARFYKDSGSIFIGGLCYKIDSSVGLSEQDCNIPFSIPLDGRNYERQIKADDYDDSNPDTDLIQVSSSVSWVDAGGLSKNVVITTVLDNE